MHLGMMMRIIETTLLYGKHRTQKLLSRPDEREICQLPDITIRDILLSSQ